MIHNTSKSPGPTGKGDTPIGPGHTRFRGNNVHRVNARNSGKRGSPKGSTGTRVVDVDDELDALIERRARGEAGMSPTSQPMSQPKWPETTR